MTLIKISKIKLILISLIILSFAACSGEDGMQGPAGPAGPAGAPGLNGEDGEDGLDGQDGEDGQDGADGNANVQNFTYTIMPADWSNGSASISIPELTDSIANTGQVVVYFTSDSLQADTISWNVLPYRFAANVNGTNQFVTIQSSFSVGQIRISARLNTNAGVNISNSTNIRVILIPSVSLVDGVNINNYEELKMVYNIGKHD